VARCQSSPLAQGRAGLPAAAPRLEAGWRWGDHGRAQVGSPGARPCGRTRCAGRGLAGWQAGGSGMSPGPGRQAAAKPLAIVLQDPSGAGKSSTAAALQDSATVPPFHVSLDVFVTMWRCGWPAWPPRPGDAGVCCRSSPDPVGAKVGSSLTALMFFEVPTAVFLVPSSRLSGPAQVGGLVLVNTYRPRAAPTTAGC